MTKLIIGLFLAISVGAHAQGVRVEKPILCFETKQFLKEIKEKYQEEPMIIGKTTGVKGVVTAWYINSTTGSFTVVEMDDEDTCIISVGTSAYYRVPKLGSTT